MLIGRFFASSLRFARRAVANATLPLTQSSVAKTQRNIWGATKHFAADLVGKGAPLYDRAAGIRNLSWDRMRGTLVNPNYENDGRLVLSLRDGVVSEESLQLLEALDNSEIGKLDPSSKGLQGGLGDIGLAFTHMQANNQCKTLVELRRSLEMNSGGLAVERSPDGFSRMLKITIDTNNKTVEDIQKEIENVFGALGIGSPDLAKSLAEELIHARDTGMETSNLVSQTYKNPSKTPTSGPVAEQGSGRDVASGAERTASDRGASHDTDVVELASGASRDSAVMNDCVAESFSMSGGVSPVSPDTGVDHITRQTQFLEESDRIAGSSMPQQSGSSLNMDTIIDAAAGLEDMSHDQSPRGTTQESPYATPVSQAARGATSQGKGM
ncbi:hypothetical protein [Candidatus Anaplasma sp. TIGMIC]|uniref:hypothetical protein n=1 Tax=Candidatus Anaplasma sp. TIGMIC TaxID=3020713 RepID=UPI00232DABFA|nr:hypothetical protein [Candidatus Anaplasma sp. TIGMIC]MDB1135096.1 hypothetical protein [Candidatus Anaplasma sp. TIGMIC]